MIAMAQRLGAGAKLPTVMELCRDLGVSKITVARALDILAEQGVLVRRHGVGIFVASSIAPRPVLKIVLLCDASLLQKADHSSFWRALIDKIRERSEAGNEYLTLHFVSENESSEVWRQQLLNSFSSGQLDGVLGVHIPTEVADWLHAMGLPAVHYAGSAPFVVYVDTDEMVCLAARELKDRGCRRIAIWSAIAPYTKMPDTYLESDKSVFSLLAAQGTPIEYSNVENNLDLMLNPTRLTTKSQQEQGYDTAMKVFSRPREQWPDGVFIAEDSTARGVLTAFQKLGIEIGKDVIVASHLNKGSDILLGHEDELILVDVDPAEIVQAMFNSLESLMRGDYMAETYILIHARLRQTPKS